MTARCSHLDQIRDVQPRTPKGCEECLKTHGTWVHLRLCLTCGHVGCCDQSPGKHATKHFHASSHPIMRSFERGEDWGWCYVDEIMFEPAPKVGETRVPAHPDPADPKHGEWLIDEGDDESFPASDPSSVTQPHGKPRKGR